MQDKITIRALIAHVAIKSGIKEEESEKFVKAFFSLISAGLEKGDAVKIKNLGTFRLIDVENRRSVNVADGSDIIIPEHKKIIFIPTREVADRINAPFEMFESVELNVDAEQVVEGPVDIRANDLSAEEDRTDIIESINESAVEKPIHTIAEAESISDTLANDPVADEIGADEVSTEDIIEDMPKRSSRGVWKFLIGFACGLLVAIIACLVAYYYFLNNYGKITEEVLKVKNVDPRGNDSKVNAELISEDSLAHKNIAAPASADPTVSSPDDEDEMVNTRPSDAGVEDIIGNHRYLTTMAQDHYGNFNFWPYIYEENKAFLGHPDRIRPGTKVIVPLLSKYGVDPKNPEDIKIAKQKGIEIYARYSK